MSPENKMYFQKCGFVEAAKKRVEETFPKIVKAGLSNRKELEEIIRELEEIIEMIAEAKQLTPS